MAEVLGRSTVRYLKNGRGGKWWPAAKERHQAHFGWSRLPGDLLLRSDLRAIEEVIRDRSKDEGAATRDLSQIREVLEDPDRHIWITFEDGRLWWCTLRRGPTVNREGESEAVGHFWLECEKPWSNRSIGGRILSVTDLSGRVTSTAGFRGTLCTPKAEAEVLRILSDQKNEDAVALQRARDAYEATVEVGIQRLTPQDFEHLVDLVLVRSGWVRVSTLGGVLEWIDLEVKNAAADETAFVQVKSAADQAVLDDYVQRFGSRRELYSRLIVAVHTPKGKLNPPSDLPVQVWTGRHMARLAVRLGLGEWVEGRLA